MRKARHRSKNVGVWFNLSTDERNGSSWSSLLALGGGAGVLCGLLVFAFDRHETPSTSDRNASSTDSGIQEPLGRPLGNYSVRFERCGRTRYSCVVDGDTLWLQGDKIRIADIDTPEISNPKCPKEYELGMLATQRLIELLNEGEFSVAASAWGEQDRYGRKLRLIVRHKVSIGDRLVQEGLAHRWVGHKLSWCQPEIE